MWPASAISEILVALNPETAKDDILALPAGSAAIYEENMNLKQYRDDVVCYPVPFDKITASVCPEAKLRKLVRNMVYVGVVAQMLDIDLGVVEKSVAQAVRQEAEGVRPQLRRRQGRLGLRAGEARQAGSLLHRADGPDRRQDHHRRQRGLRHGRGVRGSHGGRVVSHHAVHVADRSHHRPAQEVPRHSGRQSHLRRCPG